MATIKVIYNSIARRFNITSSTTWVELESKLRSLYNIPNTSSLIVSYTDEDDDVITLSSDLELKEVLSQQSSGRPIKLVLNTVEGNNNLVENSLSPQQNQAEEQQTAEREENRQPYYQHVFFNEEDEEPEYDQSTPKEEGKGKETENQNPERTSDTNTQQENDKENDEEDEDDNDDIIFIVSYPWTRPTCFGPRFGPRFGPGLFNGPRFGPGSFDGPRFGPGSFDGPRFGPGSFDGPRFGPGSFDGPRFGPGHCSFSPFNFYGRSHCHRPFYFNEYGSPSAYYYFSSRKDCSDECGQKPNSCNGRSKSCCSKRQSSCNENAEASTSAAAQYNRCGRNNCNRSSRPSCNRNFNFFHPHYYKQTPLTQEKLNDKLSTLHSMGFDSSNNALYEDLLRRYNGDLERAIELLLRNQQANEYFDNENNEQI